MSLEHPRLAKPSKHTCHTRRSFRCWKEAQHTHMREASLFTAVACVVAGMLAIKTVLDVSTLWDARSQLALQAEEIQTIQRHSK